MQATLPDCDTHLISAPPASAGFVERRPLDTPLGRLGPLEVRLARNATEVSAAQEVRYRVFYDELGARYSGLEAQERRDADRFDAVCDHLLVFDNSLPGPDHRRIVGTYRLLRQEIAFGTCGFYSQEEFDLAALVARHPQLRFLELGRSCVLPEYRSRGTISVLWQGIWNYVTHHRIDVMTGCASFPGSDPQVHAQSLSYLAHNCRADLEWDACAVAGRSHPMNLVSPAEMDARLALYAMPPLIKAYLRIGAKVGDGCVIDHQFDTVDVFIIMPVKAIAARYVSFYSGDGVSFAA